MINKESLRPLKGILIKIAKWLSSKDRNSVEYLLEHYPPEKALFILKEKAETKSKRDLERLAYYFLRSGEPEKAGQLLESSGQKDSLVLIQAEICCGKTVSKVIAHRRKGYRKLSRKAYTLFSKSVKTREDKDKLKKVVLTTKSLDNEHSIWRLRLIGEAARRVGDYQEALVAYRRAFELIYPETGTCISTGNAKTQFKGNKSRVKFDVKKAWRALNNFRELALPGWFIDAGTLLGFIREGDFLKHDYDLDISYIDPEAFAQTRRNLYQSPLFEMQPGRVPEVFKICHVNGMDLDLFLYKKAGAKMIKESHVYRWVFDAFELSEREFKGAVLPIPSNPEQHLASIYGDWWVPQRDFDGRYDALNVSFPNIDELECVLLNKSIIAIQRRDYSSARKELEMLKKVGRDHFLSLGR